MATDFLVFSKPDKNSDPDRIVGITYGKKADEGEAAIRELADVAGAVYVAVPLGKAVELEATEGGFSFQEPAEPEQVEPGKPRPAG